MRRIAYIGTVTWLNVILNMAHAQTVTLPDRAKPVIAKGIEFLEADMARWRSEQGCAACHHGPMYLWSLNLARKQGYAVNEPALGEMTHWLLSDEEARLLPKPVTKTPATASSQAADRVMAAMMGRRGLLQPSIYLAHALRTLPEGEPLRQEAWQQVLNHFAQAQMPDGSFVGAVGRPPIFNTPQILTLTAVLALAEADSQPDSLRLDDTARQTLRRATAWLDLQSADETHQGLVLRLWLSSLDPQASPKTSELISTLRSQQRSDGGWSQAAEMASDAFATGQTLYVLQRAGIREDDLAVARGIEFLVRSQRDDGTWAMISRPHPETASRAENLNPITYAACAWGVLGLVSHIPAQSP